MSKRNYVTPDEIRPLISGLLDRLENLEERVALQGARIDSGIERATAISERADVLSDRISDARGMIDALRDGIEAAVARILDLEARV